MTWQSFFRSTAASTRTAWSRSVGMGAASTVLRNVGAWGMGKSSGGRTGRMPIHLEGATRNVERDVLQILLGEFHRRVGTTRPARRGAPRRPASRSPPAGSRKDDSDLPPNAPASVERRSRIEPAGTSPKKNGGSRRSREGHRARHRRSPCNKVSRTPNGTNPIRPRSRASSATASRPRSRSIGRRSQSGIHCRGCPRKTTRKLRRRGFRLSDLVQGFGE